MRGAGVVCLTGFLAGCVPTADFVALRDEVRTLQEDQGRAASQAEGIKKLEALDAQIVALKAAQHRLEQTLETMLRQADHASRPTGAQGTGAVSEPTNETQAGKPSLPMDPAPPAALTPTALYNQAYNDYLKGQYDLAIAGFEDVLKKFPDSSRSSHAQYWIGRSHSTNKDYRRAVTAYEIVIADYPKSDKAPAAFFEVALAHAELGEITKARERFQQVIEQYPQSNEASRARLKLARFEQP